MVPRKRQARMFLVVLLVLFTFVEIADRASAQAPPVVRSDVFENQAFPEGVVQLTGTSTVTGSSVRVTLVIRDEATGLHLQSDHSWGPAEHEFMAITSHLDETTYSWWKTLELPPGRYAAKLAAGDESGLRDANSNTWRSFSVFAAPNQTARHRWPLNVQQDEIWYEAHPRLFKARDPILWPYPPESIWNHPLGHAADLVPAGIRTPSARTLNIEEDIIILAPDAAPRPVMSHTAAWRDGVRRCDQATSNVELSAVPLPQNWSTDPIYHGSKPNHSAAILMPDMTLVETQPFHMCEDGSAVSQFSSRFWQGDSILQGGNGPPRGGAHGGSGLTAFGGTIRLGEWIPGGEIRHAVKIEVYGRENLSREAGGFRWPATNADSAYHREYGGSVPSTRMGALLGLPRDFAVEQLQSEPARILARALQRYGAYVVDNTGWSTVAFAVEWGPQGRVKDEFENAWGFPMVGDVKETRNPDQLAFLTDMVNIYASLHVVDDNAPNAIGGAGVRLAQWAPPHFVVP